MAGTLGQATRKTYGAEQQLHTSAEWIGLIIVGIGGLIALAGGILFVLIAMVAIYRMMRPSDTSPLESFRQLSAPATAGCSRSRS